MFTIHLHADMFTLSILVTYQILTELLKIYFFYKFQNIPYYLIKNLNEIMKNI